MDRLGPELVSTTEYTYTIEVHLAHKNRDEEWPSKCLHTLVHIVQNFFTNSTQNKNIVLVAPKASRTSFTVTAEKRLPIRELHSLIHCALNEVYGHPSFTQAALPTCANIWDNDFHMTRTKTLVQEVLSEMEPELRDYTDIIAPQNYALLKQCKY